MMIKLLGAMLIVGAGFISGRFFSEKLRLRMRELETLSRMAAFMETQIRFNSLPLPELFEAMEGTAGMESLPFIGICRSGMERGRPFPIAFDLALQETKEDMHLEDSDYEQLQSLKHELGCTDIDGQLKILSLFQQVMKKNHEEAKEKFSTSGLMYRRLGLLAGIGLAILIL